MVPTHEVHWAMLCTACDTVRCVRCAMLTHCTCMMPHQLCGHRADGEEACTVKALQLQHCRCNHPATSQPASDEAVLSTILPPDEVVHVWRLAACVSEDSKEASDGELLVAVLS